MEAPIGCKVGRNGRIEPPRRGGGTIRTTTIMPGAIETELKTGTSDAASRTFVDDFYKLAIPVDSIARAIAFAIEQPADVGVNQIVIRPTVQEF